MKISIKGHPDHVNSSGFNEGKYRKRHNLVLNAARKALDALGVEYSIIHQDGKMPNPRSVSNYYSTWRRTVKNVLEGYDVIVLNEKIAWTNPRKEYNVYFYVKSADYCKVTYNGRIGLVGCIDTEMKYNNFMAGSRQGSERFSLESTERYGKSDSFCDYVDENANGEIEVDVFVARMIEYIKAFKEAAKAHQLETFKVDIAYNSLRGLVKNLIASNVPEQSELHGAIREDVSDRNMKWYANVGNRIPSYYNSFCVNVEKDVPNGRVNVVVRAMPSTQNDIQMSVSYAVAELEVARKEVPELINTAICSYDTLVQIIRRR